MVSIAHYALHTVNGTQHMTKCILYTATYKLHKNNLHSEQNITCACACVLHVHTAQSTIITAHCTEYNSHSTLHRVQFSQHTAQSTILTAHCTEYNSHSTLHRVQFSQHTAQSTILTTHCTEHNSHSTLYRVQFSQ